MTKNWKPSARSQELIAAMWDAFAAGDKWVRFTRRDTARMTGLSVVTNGIGEFDELISDSKGVSYYSMRIRLSSEWLALNGYPTRDHAQYVADLAELAELDRLDAQVAA